MNTELQRKTEHGMSFSDMASMAHTLLKSGFLPHAIKTPEQALTIMVTGKELGLGFMESLRSINVIQGKPTMSAQLLLGLCYRTKEVEKAYCEEESEQKCVYVLQRKGSPEYKSVFTIQDAQRMGLAGKDNWKKQPATMLKWRAISAACRVVFPDAISGVYTPEEIADSVTIETVNGEPAVTEVHTPEDKEERQGDEIPDDQLANWVMPKGKYAGLRLIEIYGQQTDTGKAVGREYLEWCAENLKTASYKGLIERFLQVMNEVPMVDVE